MNERRPFKVSRTRRELQLAALNGKKVATLELITGRKQLAIVADEPPLVDGTITDDRIGSNSAVGAEYRVGAHDSTAANRGACADNALGPDASTRLDDSLRKQGHEALKNSATADDRPGAYVALRSHRGVGSDLRGAVDLRSRIDGPGPIDWSTPVESVRRKVFRFKGGKIESSTGRNLSTGGDRGMAMADDLSAITDPDGLAKDRGPLTGSGRTNHGADANVDILGGVTVNLRRLGDDRAETKLAARSNPGAALDEYGRRNDGAGTHSNPRDRCGLREQSRRCALFGRRDNVGMRRDQAATERRV